MTLEARTAELMTALKNYLQAKTPALTDEVATGQAGVLFGKIVGGYHPLVDPLLDPFYLRYPYSWRYGLGWPYRYPLGGSSLTYTPGNSYPGYGFPHPAYGYYGDPLAGNPAFTSGRSPRG